MTLFAKPFRLAAAAVYRIAYKLHHKLFLRPQPPLRTPVVIVGSYLAGGAGKTPFTTWLAKRLQEQGKKVAVLCHKAAWDEFILLQNSLPQSIKVIATNNRYATAKDIQDKFDIIVCDDGFEDTRLTGALCICLDWGEPPTSWTKLWPAGPYRSLKQDHDENTTIHLDCRSTNNGQGVIPSAISYSIESITNFIPGKPLNATVICGLGNPQRFIEDIRAFGINVENAIIRRDHDKRFLQFVKSELSHNRDVVISQKDACRLPESLLASPRIHIAIQKITVPEAVVTRIASAIKG